MSTTLNPETAEWLDGPAFVAWFKDRMNGHRIPEAMIRRMWEWEHHGEQPSVWTVDHYLTQIGLHIRDIPSEIWRDPPINPGQQGKVQVGAPGRRGYPRQLRLAALRAVEAGEKPFVVADRYGIQGKTVMRWAKEAGIK